MTGCAKAWCRHANRRPGSGDGSSADEAQIERLRARNQRDKGDVAHERWVDGVNDRGESVGQDVAE